MTDIISYLEDLSRHPAVKIDILHCAQLQREIKHL